MQRSQHFAAHKTIKGIDWLHGSSRDPQSRYVRIWHASLFGNVAEVEYRRADYANSEDPGWYYYGHGIFGRYLARSLAEALEEATDILHNAAPMP
jgi:hypothetical protein